MDGRCYRGLLLEAQWWRSYSAMPPPTSRYLRNSSFFWDWNRVDTNWHTEHVLNWPDLCDKRHSHEQTLERLILNAEGCKHLMVEYGVEYNIISLSRFTVLRYLEMSARGLLGYQSNTNTAVHSLGERLSPSLETLTSLECDELAMLPFHSDRVLQLRSIYFPKWRALNIGVLSAAIQEDQDEVCFQSCAQLRMGCEAGGVVFSCIETVRLRLR